MERALWGSRERSSVLTRRPRALRSSGFRYLLGGGCALALLLMPARGAASVLAESGVFVRTGIFNSLDGARRLSREKLDLVSASLERVTGWRGIHFEDDAVLCLRETRESGTGSATARTLVLKAVRTTAIVLEDHSRSFSVAFAAIRRDALYHLTSGEVIPRFTLLLDFDDFQYLAGHPEALAAFDLGFVLLHELVHAVEDRRDPIGLQGASEPGDCETIVNEVRRELGLPVRAHYHSERVIPSLLSDFSLGRLRFERVVERAGKPRIEVYFVQWPKNFVVR
jgi:hypothetical protein